MLVVEDRRASSLRRGHDQAKAQAAAVAAALSRTSSSAARTAVATACSDTAAAAAAKSAGSGGGGAGGSAVAAVTLSPASSIGGALPLSRASTLAPELVILEEEDIGYPLGWRVADAFAVITLLTLTGVSIWWAATRTAYTSSPFAQSSLPVAVLMGPFGCYLRFYLSRLNGSMAGRHAWFPLGTFLANMIACTVNYSIRAGIDRSTVPVGLVTQAALSGVMLGFSGSLSTVSTWVVEVGAPGRCWLGGVGLLGWWCLGGSRLWGLGFFCYREREHVSSRHQKPTPTPHSPKTTAQTAAPAAAAVVPGAAPRLQLSAHQHRRCRAAGAHHLRHSGVDGPAIVLPTRGGCLLGWLRQQHSNAFVAASTGSIVW